MEIIRKKFDVLKYILNDVEEWVVLVEKELEKLI